MAGTLNSLISGNLLSLSPSMHPDPPTQTLASHRTYPSHPASSPPTIFAHYPHSPLIGFPPSTFSICPHHLPCLVPYSTLLSHQIPSLVASGYLPPTPHLSPSTSPLHLTWINPSMPALISALAPPLSWFHPLSHEKGCQPKISTVHFPSELPHDLPHSSSSLFFSH